MKTVPSVRATSGASSVVAAQPLTPIGRAPYEATSACSSWWWPSTIRNTITTRLA